MLPLSMGNLLWQVMCAPDAKLMVSTRMRGDHEGRTRAFFLNETEFGWPQFLCDERLSLGNHHVVPLLGKIPRVRRVPCHLHCVLLGDRPDRACHFHDPQRPLQSQYVRG